MQLLSSAFNHMESIPVEYSCDGNNINPELIIKEVPPHAKSLVLIMDDPDVPDSVCKDCIWDHWVVFNIPPNFFKLYALDCELDLSEGSNKSQVELAMQGHIVAQAELVGKYKRI